MPPAHAPRYRQAWRALGQVSPNGGREREGTNHTIQREGGIKNVAVDKQDCPAEGTYCWRGMFPQAAIRFRVVESELGRGERQARNQYCRGKKFRSKAILRQKPPPPPSSCRRFLLPHRRHFWPQRHPRGQSGAKALCPQTLLLLSLF